MERVNALFDEHQIRTDASNTYSRFKLYVPTHQIRTDALNTYWRIKYVSDPSNYTYWLIKYVLTHQIRIWPIKLYVLTHQIRTDASNTYSRIKYVLTHQMLFWGPNVKLTACRLLKNHLMSNSNITQRIHAYNDFKH